MTVRLACRKCPRRGQYRLARLAARYGADIGMINLLEHLAGDCRDRRPRHPFKDRCGAFFVDLDAPPRPPDEPGPGGLRVIPGGRAA